MKHKIKIFTADCPLCPETMDAVRGATRECGCEITEIRCEGTECCQPAKDYGIRAVPTIVVDGKIVHVGKLSAEEFGQYI